MAGAVDLDGNDRIIPPGGTVDMGCYEFVPEPGTLVALLAAFLINYRLRMTTGN
jgi:hypothetical protein